MTMAFVTMTFNTFYGIFLRDNFVRQVFEPGVDGWDFEAGLALPRSNITYILQDLGMCLRWARGVLTRPLLLGLNCTTVCHKIFMMWVSVHDGAPPPPPLCPSLG